METGSVTVRLFGLLRSSCAELGLPVVLTTEVPEEGISARELAVGLGLNPKVIEGVFVNHTMYGLSQRVIPGDRVGFVPYGTPGPHRVYLGLYKAGRSNQED
jgi:hypothetical protein